MNGSCGELLISRVQEAPDRPVFGSPGAQTTIAELSAAAGALATTLREAGLGGERTGILLPNGLQFPLALHAVFRCAGSALLLNPLNSSREVQEQFDDAEARTILTIEALAGLAPPNARCVFLDRLPESVSILEGGLTRRVPVRPADPSADRFGAPEDEAVVIFTSAMAGRARGAVLSHRNLVVNLTATIDALGMTSNDRLLAVLPFAHAFGLTVCLNAPLAAGSAVRPLPRFSPVAALDTLAAEGITVVCGVPAMYIGLLAAAAKKGVPDHSLRVALSGGALLPLEVARQWEEAFGLPLRQGYGLTEASPVCLFNRVDRPNRIGTLGEPLAGVEVSIRDLEGEPLDDGEVGELWVRGGNVFKGYLDDLPAGDSRSEDWLRTGDLASLNAGSVRFGGTVKAMFTRNGFNVYPEEVRRAILQDARIREARVYARPDLERENEVVLTVIATPGADLSETDVRELCAARLAAYKRPSTIQILPSRPEYLSRSVNSQEA